MEKPSTFSDVLVFKPTLKEIKNFPKYMAYIDSVLKQNEELGALAKIVCPEGAIIRQSGYSKESIGPVLISSETVQTISGSNGYFQIDSRDRVPKKIKTVAAFLDSATSENPLTTEIRERLFWAELTNPDREGVYYQNIDGSLMDKFNKYGNMHRLGTLLDHHSGVIAGVTSPMLYYGVDGSIFAIHVEDDALHSISFLHWTTVPGCKIWYGVPPKYRAKFEEFLKSNFEEEYKKCPVFWKHKMHLVDPIKILASGIPVQRAVQRSGEYIVTTAGAYHFGFTIDKTIGEATNMALLSSVEYYKNEKACNCKSYKLKKPILLDYDHLSMLFLLSHKNWSTKVFEFLPVTNKQEDKTKKLELMLDETVNNISCNMESKLDPDTGDIYYRYKYQAQAGDMGEWKKIVSEIKNSTMEEKMVELADVSVLQIEPSTTKESSPPSTHCVNTDKETNEKETKLDCGHNSAANVTPLYAITYPSESMGATCDVMGKYPMDIEDQSNLSLSVPVNVVEIHELGEEDSNEIVVACEIELEHEEFLKKNSLDNEIQAKTCFRGHSSPNMPFTLSGWPDGTNEYSSFSLLDEMDELGAFANNSIVSASQSALIEQNGGMEQSNNEIVFENTEVFTALAAKMNEKGLGIVESHIQNFFEASSSAMEMGVDMDTLRRTVRLDHMIDNVKSKLLDAEDTQYEKMILKVLEATETGTMSEESASASGKMKNIPSNIQRGSKRKPEEAAPSRTTTVEETFQDKLSFEAENKLRSTSFEIGKANTCFICQSPSQLPKKFASNRGYLNHVAKHVVNMGMTCDLCGQKYPYQTPYNRHRTSCELRNKKKN